MAYGFEKTVLDMHAPYFTLPCLVANTGITADANGKKIIYAGTPVGGTTSALETRNTVLIVTNNANAATAAASDGKNSQGVVVHDVDVTAGNATATVAFMGVIDLSKALSTLTINSAAATALNKIIFMKSGR